MIWTDERCDLLRELVPTGLSCSAIAVRMGGMTRNAIIGKIHRLGLKGPPRVVSEASPEQREKWRRARANTRRKDQRQEYQIRLHSAAPEVVEAPLPDPDPDVIPPTACSLLDLTTETCRWPFGDPGTSGFAFCGGPTIDGLAYCVGHCRMAYRPADHRRRTVHWSRNGRAA